ncbi:MAG: hypothetical protein KDC14_00120, partial [Planctomycetes bacterium]|nr:hypothetical protein [Planctomycetota bacterium]
MRAITTALADGQEPRAFVVRGGVGSGKTHFMHVLEDACRERGIAVRHVEDGAIDDGDRDGPTLHLLDDDDASAHNGVWPAAELTEALGPEDV